MALEMVTDSGVVTVPGATVQVSVQATAAGLGTTGIVAILGEATEGLDYASEADFAATCLFGPDQESDVLAKYGSGPIVDAFRACTAPANDPEIQGAPAGILIVKTNVGTAATSTLAAFSGSWGAIKALTPGAKGNLYSRTVTAVTSEVVPTTGAFTFLPPIATTDADLRVNGGAAVAYSIAAQQTPTTFVTNVDALAGVAATGGADRGIIGSASGTIAIAVVSGNAVTLTRSIAWSVVPTVGDTLFISSTSVIKGGANENVGSYVVTAATSTTISATKLLDASGTPNQLTAPTTVTAQTILSTTADARCWAPVTISLEAGNPLPGAGKSLEVSELVSSSGRLAYILYALSVTPVTWVSRTGAATDLTSATEYRTNLNVSRQSDGVSEDLTAGGEILLKLGYTGTTASAVVASGNLTITVTGGAGTSPAAIALAAFGTIGDLAVYLNTLTGFTCAVGSAAIASRPATDLDAGTFGVASTFGAANGRLKGDAASLNRLLAISANVRASGAAATTGLPAPAATVFLAGGTRGATTDAVVAAAFLAMESADVNFVVPLMSNDASVDVADGLTDSASTYTIAAVHANARSHGLKMGQLNNYSPRMIGLSIRGSFASDKTIASNVASEICYVTFEDVRNPGGTSGAVQQFRPWYGAVIAAAYQAAAFRKAIFHKGVNIIGAIQAAGDFNPRNKSMVTAALRAGLLPLAPLKSGGWQFISDQTSWTATTSFFNNSIQAVYGAQIIGRTLQQDLENGIVGQSVADVGRTQVLSMLRDSADKLRSLKLIAPSDDAPLGYKNEDAKVTPPTVQVSIEMKEATALYFVNIRLRISAVTQTG